MERGEAEIAAAGALEGGVADPVRADLSYQGKEYPNGLRTIQVQSTPKLQTGL